MLTGDRQPTADLIAREAGVDDVRAQLSPEDKVAAVQQLKEAGAKVAMIGDGVNDAPCLAAADVGVAMGARGSDAAMEQAEVVLMNDRLENFVTAYDLSRRAKRHHPAEYHDRAGTVIVMALLAVTRGIPLSLGVVAHEGSTVDRGPEQPAPALHARPDSRVRGGGRGVRVDSARLRGRTAATIAAAPLPP